MKPIYFNKRSVLFPCCVGHIVNNGMANCWIVAWFKHQNMEQLSISRFSSALVDSKLASAQSTRRTDKRFLWLIQANHDNCEIQSDYCIKWILQCDAAHVQRSRVSNTRMTVIRQRTNIVSDGLLEYFRKRISFCGV